MAKTLRQYKERAVETFRATHGREPGPDDLVTVNIGIVTVPLAWFDGGNADFPDESIDDTLDDQDDDVQDDDVQDDDGL